MIDCCSFLIRGLASTPELNSLLSDLKIFVWALSCPAQATCPFNLFVNVIATGFSQVSSEPDPSVSSVGTAGRRIKTLPVTPTFCHSDPNLILRHMKRPDIFMDLNLARSLYSGFHNLIWPTEDYFNPYWPFFLRRHPPEDLPPWGDVLHPRDGDQDVDPEQGVLHQRHPGGHTSHASHLPLKGADVWR